MSYTLASVLAVVLVGVADQLVFRTNLLRRKTFWTSYAIIVLFQLVVNGLLTGLRVVRYDPGRIAGWHLVHAPVEDLLFGFALVLLTLMLWVWTGRRAGRSGRGASR